VKVLGVIPARYGSTRLEGKPLVDICGQPMIERVYRRASAAACLHLLLVATDDERIVAAVESFGGQALLTDSSHKSGTDRVAEVAREHSGFDIVVNIQGDEPLLDPRVIDQVVAPLATDRSLVMSTPARLLKDSEHDDPNIVKVVMDNKGDALYFSRSPIPYPRIKGEFRIYEHLGLYCYRRDFLLRLARMPHTPLERIESLEQLRVLEHGYSIRVVVTEFAEASVSVDTPEDLERARAIIAATLAT